MPQGQRRPIYHRPLAAGLLSLISVVLSGQTAHAGDLAAAKKTYVQNCANCHGMTGKGNGPSGKALTPKPTDFTTAERDEAKWLETIKGGSKTAAGKPPAMKAFAGVLTEAQIRGLLAYLKTLKP